MSLERRWDEKPPQPEITKIASFLASKGMRQNIIGSITAGTTRRDIAADLRTFLRQLPKAK